MIFSPFGQFMAVLGGSVFQVLVPIICAISFVYQTRNGFLLGQWHAVEN